MPANITMKFTLDTNKSETKTLSQIRSMPKSTTLNQASGHSNFSMRNLGRVPQLTLNNFGKSKSKSGGCGCCGG